MNNGLTGEGRARKRIRDEVYGKPQGSAKLILARPNRSEWEYRGIRFTGRKLGGWNGGSEWVAPGIALTHSKQAIMVMIDRHLDGAACESAGKP